MFWLLSATALGAPLSSLSSGDLVVSEVHASPAAATTNRGQWFEVYNASGGTVDLNGLVVGDGGSQTFTVSRSLEVSAGEAVLFATRASSSLNGGLPTVDYVYSTASYSLAAGNEALVLSHGATIFDAVSFGGVSFADPYGASLSLDPLVLDAASNDSGGNWCPAMSGYGAGDYGTPGAVNDGCPVDLSVLSAGDLVVTEVMHTPAASAYNKGEWFEVYNASGLYISLDGLTVDSGAGESLVLSGGAVVRPGEYAIFAARTSSLQNGGLPTVDYRYVYSTDLVLKSTDGLVLSYGVTTFDEVSWNPADYAGGSGVADQLNATLTSEVDNDDGASWCAATTTYGAGDYGTPGAANSDCDPDSDGDGYTEDVDCDEEDAAVYPGAPELCDGIDNDCDLLIDDSPAGGTTYYADLDYDFYGAAGGAVVACSRPRGYRTNGLDCNDASAAVKPNAAETCDGTDNNCSGSEADASDISDWYADLDGDSYGDGSASTSACFQPGGHVADSTDCDDGSAGSYPGAAEACNDGIDQDCDGEDYGTCDASLADLDGRIYGASASDQIGGGIASVGDLDGDTVADFTLTSASAIYLFDGATSWAGRSTTADAAAVLTGSSGDVSGGDIDGDGYDDLFIGNSTIATGGAGAGGGYVVYGPLTGSLGLPGGADATLLGDAAGDSAGGTALVIGDIDNDGNDDLLITASGDDTSAANAGAAYLLLGPPASGDLSDVAYATYTSDSANDYLGRGAAVVGDIDADGAQDVMINAYREDRTTGGTTLGNVGATWLLSGFSAGIQDIEAASAAVVYGESALDQTGSVLSGAGDVDGDGYDDVLVASWYADPSGRTDAGEVYLLLGPLSGEVSVADGQARFPGVAAGDAAGRAVAGLGDINGDSAGDIIVGAKLADAGGVDAGAAYVVLGPLSGSIDLSLADTILAGEAGGDRAGLAITRIPDHDGGGQDDILIGASLNSTEANDSGAAYLLFTERW